MTLTITCPDCDEDFTATGSADIQTASDAHAAACPQHPTRRSNSSPITCPDCGKVLAEIGKAVTNPAEQIARAHALHTCHDRTRRTPMTTPPGDGPPRRPVAQQLLTHPTKAVARQAAKVVAEEAKLTEAWRADLTNAKLRSEIAAKEAAIAAELDELKKMKAALRGSTTGPTPPAGAPPAVPMDEVRAWALANGHKVATKGKIAQTTAVDAWQAATQGVQA